MAIKQANKTTSGAAAPMSAVSLNPDNMVSAGLMDDFDGRITKARFVPWDYNGNLDHHILAVAIGIQPDEGDEFTQHYSCGELEHFAPSVDGSTPVDLENGEGEALEGPYAVPVGKRAALNNNTNFAQFMMALMDAGFDKSKLSPSLEFLEGVYGHFNRIPQKKRSGIVNAAEGDQARRRSNDILVVTELKAAPAGTTGKTGGAGKPNGAAGRPTSAPATSAATQAVSGDDLDDQLAAIVVGALSKAGDDGLPKNKLAGLALKGLPGNLKAKGVKRIVDPTFLESREEFAFDPDSGTVLAV